MEIKYVPPLYIPKDSKVNKEITIEKVGLRLKKIRKKRGLTKTELAESSGLSKKTISNLEGGLGISLANLFKILKVLKLSHRLEQMFSPIPVSPRLSALKKLKRQKKLK